ncbi:glucosylceramidase [Bacteroidales bacterium]|nr:glucosylceramidase [Bacteroidales bacterium]
MIHNNNITALILLLCSTISIAACNNDKKKEVQGKQVSSYTTTADESKIFDVAMIDFDQETSLDANIILDTTIKHQTMDGFGVAITGSSCYNLLQMSSQNRTAILKETFHPRQGMAYSYIRISIGCSDFSLDEYTCCDIPPIDNFEIHQLDKRDLFPILREIKAINPNVKIIASPWTCPKWMKVDNLKDLQAFDSWTSGQLNPKYYQDYATYFVNFIQEMSKEGFPINAITIQNEPLNRGNSASLFMTWQEQKEFIKTALGPKFTEASLDTEIWAFDHNYDYDAHKDDCKDQIAYPLRIYEDQEAAQYISGAAYHAYGGNVGEMLRVHEQRPDKGLIFTEMSIGLWGSGYTFANDLLWNMREVCIGSINNFCKAVIMWNYMLDEKHGPDRPGGCDICLGAIDIQSSDYASIKKNSHYYTMAHLSKVIDPNAIRIGSHHSLDSGIHYSAFINPDQSYAIVLLNDNDMDKEIVFTDNNQSFRQIVEAKSVVSYRWSR